MINVEEFERQTIRGLMNSLSFSREVIDRLDPNYEDIEGRKKCVSLLSELKDCIEGEE